MIQSRPHVRTDDVDRVLANVGAFASRRRRPALAILVGLPGTGKSRVAEELRALTGAIVLESDALRRLLFPVRTYASAESKRLFAALHDACEHLLSEGVSVIFDSTSLTEAEREPLYGVAERTGARLILVSVTAPWPVARQRLHVRQKTEAGSSDADVQVYDRMRPRLEDIPRPHHVIDTSMPTRSPLSSIAAEMTQA